jgi:hypothetical protein
MRPARPAAALVSPAVGPVLAPRDRPLADSVPVFLQ